MSVPRARVLELMKVSSQHARPMMDQADAPKARCQIFATVYNPEGIRMGNKVLRQRLRGPALAAYYPRKGATLRDVKQEFGPVLTTYDDQEEDRLEYLEA